MDYLDDERFELSKCDSIDMLKTRYTRLLNDVLRSPTVSDEDRELCPKALDVARRIVEEKLTENNMSQRAAEEKLREEEEQMEIAQKQKDETARKAAEEKLREDEKARAEAKEYAELLVRENAQSNKDQKPRDTLNFLQGGGLNNKDLCPICGAELKTGSLRGVKYWYCTQRHTFKNAGTCHAKTAPFGLTCKKLLLESLSGETKGDQYCVKGHVFLAMRGETRPPTSEALKEEMKRITEGTWGTNLPAERGSTDFIIGPETTGPNPRIHPKRLTEGLWGKKQLTAGEWGTNLPAERGPTDVTIGPDTTEPDRRKLPKQLYPAAKREQLTEGEWGGNLPAEIKRYATSIIVVPPSATLEVGRTMSFSASVLDQSGKPMPASVVWKSDNRFKGEISGTGDTAVFRAISEGTVDIIAKSGAAIGTAAVTIISPQQPAPVVSRIEVYPPSITLSIGVSQQFTARVLDQRGNEMSGVSVSWNIDNPAVGELRNVYSIANNLRCVFKAVGYGTAIITATANGASGTAIASVNPGLHPKLRKIVITPKQATVDVGNTQQFNAATLDQNNNAILNVPISWSSSDTGVGTIDAAGIFTGVSVGTATITAENGGISDTASAEVVSSGTTTPPEETESFTTYFIKKIPNILIIIIGMALFTMEQYGFGGGEFGIEYLLFAAGGSIIGIFATITTYFDIKKKQQQANNASNIPQQITP